MNTRHSTQSPLFLLAVAEVIDVEGGYVFNVSDPGGETKFGISKRQYPQLDIKALTYEMAVDIYWRDYWLARRCAELPDAFAVFLFDSVVNHKTIDAARMLQRGLGVAADGDIGPITVQAAHNNYTTATLARIFSYRADFYTFLAGRDSTLRQFRRGWFKRLFLLQQFIFKHQLIED